jgi:hypothetical protein
MSLVLAGAAGALLLEYFQEVDSSRFCIEFEYRIPSSFDWLAFELNLHAPPYLSK